MKEADLADRITVVHGHKVYTIQSDTGGASASFAPSYGALGTSLILPVNGEPGELIYQRPDFWTTERDAGGLPFLFPVCGRHMLNGQLGKYQWDGVMYDMPLHGFSMRKAWKVVRHSSDRLVMSLRDDETTRAYYPFQFQVVLDYRITGASLICRHQYINLGKQPMPFYSGFHPYFAAEYLDTEAWQIAASVKRAGQYDEHLTGIKKWTPFNSAFDPVSAAKTQLVVEIDPGQPVHLKRRGVAFLEMLLSAETDTCRLPYLQFYRSNDDPFICVEPWMGCPNGLNEPERVQVILPRETREGTFAISTNIKPLSR